MIEHFSFVQEPVNMVKSILDHLTPNTFDDIFHNATKLPVNDKPLLWQIAEVTHNLVRMRFTGVSLTNFINLPKRTCGRQVRCSIV